MLSPDNRKLSSEALTVPVLICSYKRSKHLTILLHRLIEIGIKKVYFFSDGTIDGNTDLKAILESREIFSSLSGSFQESHSLILEENLGCREGVPAALDWFFSEQDFGIILEEDCVPSPYFFQYVAKCQEIFKDDIETFCISGTKNSGGPHSSTGKSIFPLIWGWATWADRWAKYRLEFTDASEIVEWGVSLMYPRESRFTVDGVRALMAKWHWRQVFIEAGEGSIDTWDYSLIATLWRERAFSIAPEENLIVNIGFDSEATHTRSMPPDWVATETSIAFDIGDSVTFYTPNQQKVDRWINQVVHRVTLFWEIVKVAKSCLRRLSSRRTINAR